MISQEDGPDEADEDAGEDVLGGLEVAVHFVHGFDLGGHFSFALPVWFGGWVIGKFPGCVGGCLFFSRRVLGSLWTCSVC